MRNLIRALAVMAVVAVLFVLVALGPVMLCRGVGSGGNCGEWTLASLPLALLLVPLFAFLGFRWTKGL